MQFRLRLSTEAKEVIERLAKHDPKKHKKILKTLGLMEVNLRHPSLKTHKFSSLEGPNGEEVFEAYVENKAPAAFRVFWFYGPNPEEITVVAITPHP
ncbi:hypothetical protein [Acaryochloris marina]|uniref:hypothetical protein n=1 Tax=Acaryochloris marina TaxID=155978 RepID=UPI001BAEA03F|nr:hypothetical protein [Acaryochloris marina]QUY41591.1 hypothetical protein I1H34_20460 [Acaryochloris marina S15]